VKAGHRPGRGLDDLSMISLAQSKVSAKATMRHLA